MACFGRVGNLLRQAVNKQISSQLSSSPSVFQSIRCMSSSPSSKLFIGGLSYGTDERSLQEAFSKYGTVVDARVIMDRETGRSRGFGFVTLTSVEEASSAIQALDQKDLHGRMIRVNYANDRTRGFSSGGYGNASYGSGAGYGGAYGTASYGGSGSDSGYGDSGAYGGNAAGGYGGGGYGPGSYGSGGNHWSGGSGNNYATDSFGSGSTGGNYSESGSPCGSTGSYGSNTGNFGGGGSDNYGTTPGFSGAAGEGSVAGIGNSDNLGGDPGDSDSYFSAGSGGGSGGFSSSRFDESSGQLDSNESGNLGKDVGDYGEPLEGNYMDDARDFAKRP